MTTNGETKEIVSSIKEMDSAINDKINISYEESQDLYSRMAEEGSYDKVIRNGLEDYQAMAMYAKGMDGLFKDKAAVKILDVGSGSGVSGATLRKVGFVNVDGLEPCENFVKELKKKDIYTFIHESAIGLDTPVDVPDDTYDCVCGVGVFGPGHIPCSAIPEMVRIVKPGGYILVCIRCAFLEDVPEYKGRLVPTFEKLEGEGRIKKVDWTIYPNHFAGHDGVRMVFQVL